MSLETAHGVLKLITYVAVVRDRRILLVEYDTSPNPGRGGWWVPAPELEFGDAPDDKARSVLVDLGIADAALAVVETESFVTPNGWHCMFHYVATPNREASPGGPVSRVAWFGPDDLPAAALFAHGGWERRLALRRLGAPGA